VKKRKKKEKYDSVGPMCSSVLGTQNMSKLEKHKMLSILKSSLFYTHMHFDYINFEYVVEDALRTDSSLLPFSFAPKQTCLHLLLMVVANDANMQEIEKVTLKLPFSN
jgi:hypothetical protein